MSTARMIRRASASLPRLFAKCHSVCSMRTPAPVSRASRGAADLARLHEHFLGEQRFSARLSPSTLRGYRQTFALLVALMPTLGTQQLTPAAMTEFFRRLETRSRFVGRGEERVGVRTSTVATYRSKLSRFLGWLKTRGEISVNPLDGMPYPRVEYEDRKYLGKSAVERILAALVLSAPWRSRLLRTRNIALFSALLYTGVRKGELLGLRITDLDLDHLELTVRAETSKSKLRRVVPLNSRLLFVLEDYLAERRKLSLQSEHLFVSASGRAPLTAEGLKHLIEQVKRASGVRFHAHQFRHTFAVNFLNRGGDVAKLKQLLGHRDIRMTSAYLRCLPTSAMRTDVESITLDTLL
jgi:site-specific recombinase XerD